MNTKVLELIKAQTAISSYEMADHLGVSYKTEQRAVADLKKVDVIDRNRKTAYYR